MRENKLTLRLKEQIEALKGGVTEAAKHLGKSRNTIYNWIEKGNAPIDQVEKLSEIGIDIHYVITGVRMPGISNISDQHPGKINELSGAYKQSDTDAEIRAAVPASRNALDVRLDSVIDDYMRNDILTVINHTLNQVLSNKNLTLDSTSKAHLIAAAQKGYQQLATCRRTENFNDLLYTLIDATLAELNN